MLYYSVCGPRVKYLSFKCFCKIHGTCQPCQVVLKARETKNKSVCFDFDIFAACLGSKFFTGTEDFSPTQTFWRVTCYILVCHTYKIGLWWTYRATSLTNCGYTWHVFWRKWIEKPLCYERKWKLLFRASYSPSKILLSRFQFLKTDPARVFGAFLFSA